MQPVEKKKKEFHFLSPRRSLCSSFSASPGMSGTQRDVHHPLRNPPSPQTPTEQVLFVDSFYQSTKQKSQGYDEPIVDKNAFFLVPPRDAPSRFVYRIERRRLSVLRRRPSAKESESFGLQSKQKPLNIIPIVSPEDSSDIVGEQQPFDTKNKDEENDEEQSGAASLRRWEEEEEEERHASLFIPISIDQTRDSFPLPRSIFALQRSELIPEDY